MYNTFHIFLASETKIESSFPNSQFPFAGYTMFRHIEIAFGEAY